MTGPEFMNDTDPYTTPQTDVSTNPAVPGGLGGLDFKQLKKLYHRSCNVNAITFLLGLGFIALTVVSMLPDAGIDAFMKPVLIGITVFYAVAVIGLFRRTSWGRVLGIVACIISLINIPIGTLIGAFGLFAFFGAPELFGGNRVTHGELKAEFKRQKANLKNRQA